MWRNMHCKGKLPFSNETFRKIACIFYGPCRIEEVADALSGRTYPVKEEAPSLGHQTNRLAIISARPPEDVTAVSCI